MKHWLPIGPPGRTTQVVTDGSDADDVEVDVVTIGSTVIGLHPPASPQLNEASTLRFSCVGAGGGASGQPHTLGCSRHKNSTHCPASGPLVISTQPIATGPLYTVHTVGDGSASVDVEVGAGSTVRLSFLAAGGGAPGQPQVLG